MPDKKTISLVMIVKNEEKGLEKCLLSAVPYVDEIIIAVDTKSTDNTLSIAQQYADVVKNLEWQDDFAAARNFAQEGAKGDWILFLDGHEYIKKCEKLDEYLNSEHDGLGVCIEMENGMVFRNPRLYRNGVKFVGAVHEQQQCRSIQYYPEFVIQHDRQNGQDSVSASERAAQRDEMVPRIMGAEYKRDKKNSRASFHLALYWQGRGKLKRAIKWYKRCLKYSTNKGQRWYVFFNIALCRLSLRQMYRARVACEYAEKEVPHRWETRKLFGIINFEDHLYRLAVEYLLTSFEQNVGNVEYKPWKKDDAGTWNMAGECYFRLGEYMDSHIAFHRASELATNEIVKEFFKKRSDLMYELAKNK